jgi:hypothetical protein
LQLPLILRPVRFAELQFLLQGCTIRARLLLATFIATVDSFEVYEN